MKLTRKAIREGLQAVPVESLLLGAGKAKQSALTAKQKRFAEGVAMGKSKAQAYREAYDSQGKAITQGHEGHRLSRDPKVSAQIEALKLAAEAARHATPAALRALVIERLTQHAIDEDIAPAQRLRALELLGKVTEVAAFTERREVITQRDPSTARAALLDGIRAALRASAIDATPANVIGAASQGATDEAAIYIAQDAEAAGSLPPTGDAIAGEAGGLGGGPRAQARAGAQPLLSNPHTQSPENSDPRLPNFSDDQSNNVTKTPPHAS